MYVILLRKYEPKDRQHGVLLLCQLSVKGPLCRDSRAVFSWFFSRRPNLQFSDHAELLRWVFWRCCLYLLVINLEVIYETYKFIMGSVEDWSDSQMHEAVNSERDNLWVLRKENWSYCQGQWQNFWFLQVFKTYFSFILYFLGCTGSSLWHVVAYGLSLVVACRLLLLWHTGLGAPWHVGSQFPD